MPVDTHVVPNVINKQFTMLCHFSLIALLRRFIIFLQFLKTESIRFQKFQGDQR